MSVIGMQQHMPSIHPSPPPLHTAHNPNLHQSPSFGPRVDPAMNAEPLSAVHPPVEPSFASSSSPPLVRIRVSDITGYDGGPMLNYNRAVEALSASLSRCNAVVIELGVEDAVLLKCALESTKMYFRTRQQAAAGWNSKPQNRGIFIYRAGRALEEGDTSPPCMGEAFRCLGKASRVALCAIARYLRLRSDVFNHLLDDTPLPVNEASSSVLVASYTQATLQNNKGVIAVAKPSASSEVEKGLLMLIASDSPGIQVCDPNGRWYLADSGLGPGELLLLTGRALSHATAGLRCAASYRMASDYILGAAAGGRTSLAFRLMPQSNAVLDCSPMAAAGHIIAQSVMPISVSQFMDDLSTEENIMCNRVENSYLQERQPAMSSEPSLRSILSDPISGTFLEDATLVSCGHSFGGLMLQKVIETSRCSLCSTVIEGGSLIPNYALRAAALAVKNEDDRRLFHNATQRKRRREVVENMDGVKKFRKDDGDVNADSPGQSKAVQYPFHVNEKVVIKGNKRTPEKFVGREAVITSQCLNGWYLLKTLDNGESVRLQYRSLRKVSKVQSDQIVLAMQNGS